MSKRMLFFLLMVLTFTRRTAACSSSCTPTSCDCRGSRLTSVPQDLPANITRLDLRENLITTLRPADFARYGNLTYLHLGSNRISTIQRRTFRNLANLTDLYLYGNQLTSLPVGAFVGLARLQRLDLYQNRLTTLPARIFRGLGHLQHLDLYQNQLTSLSADIFEGLGNLTVLDMYQNRLTSLPPDIFAGLGNLQELWLGQNELTSLWPSTFAGLGKLRELWLGQNRLASLPDDIFGYRPGLPELRSLHLDNNQLISLGADTFFYLGNLEWLDLHRNNISSLEDFAFRSARSHLQHLDLEYNNIGTISRAAFVTPRLQTLLLSHNNINHFPAEALLRYRPPLSELRMEDNKMETLPPAAYDLLASIANVSIGNNPWQCDCRMVAFWRIMDGSHAFERQMTCAGPGHLRGKSLLHDVALGDLLSGKQTTACYNPSTPPPVLQPETSTFSSALPSPRITGHITSRSVLSTAKATKKSTSRVPSSFPTPGSTLKHDGDFSGLSTVGTLSAKGRVKSTSLPMAASSSRMTGNVSDLHLPGKIEKNASRTSSLPVFVRPLLAAIAGTLFFCACVFSVIYICVLRSSKKSPLGPSVVFNQTTATVSVLNNGRNQPYMYSKLDE